MKYFLGIDLTSLCFCICSKTTKLNSNSSSSVTIEIFLPIKDSIKQTAVVGKIKVQKSFILVPASES